MERNQTRILFLTGAPQSRSLKWTDADLSVNSLPCCSGSSKLQSSKEPPSDTVALSWRSLPLERTHLPTGLTQASRENASLLNDRNNDHESSSVVSPCPPSELDSISHDQSQGSLVSFNGDEEVLSQYYEHSFAVHEIASSQIIDQEQETDQSFVTDLDDSTLSVIADESNEEHGLVRSKLASTTTFCDLNEIPNAALVRSISPQTMTVNLVVGIISIAAARSIRTRKGGHTVELVEVLVGDSTRAGFGINIWLPSDESASSSALRSNTLQLRCQDVVLVRNVALSTFRGKVYGQSLRKGMTTLSLLYRNTVGEQDKRGVFGARELELGAPDDSVIARIQRVKDWVMEFVGLDRMPVVARREVNNPRALETLPADTQ